MTGRAFIVAVALLMGHRASAEAITEVHYVMGTYFTITIDHPDPVAGRTAMRRCFTAAREGERRFSRFDPTSELSRLNATVDGGAVTVSPEMAALLRRAMLLQTATAGSFDVRVGALTQLWRTVATWPTQAIIDRARPSASEPLELRGRTLLRTRGVRIDLDGIAKGWAVDRCVARLRAAGITRALLSLGESSLYAVGAPAGARGWELILRSLDVSRALGTLTLRDQAASVSAVFGHERRVGGRHVGHIVDPRTGWPLTTPAMAVVVSATATDAEAYSKAFLISGRLPLENSETRQSPTASRPFTGALLVRPNGVERTGAIAFTPFRPARPISAAAEPLQ